MSDLCDYCEEEAVDLFELEGKRGWGRYVYACEQHRGIAETAALSWEPADKGSLADDIRKLEKAGKCG